MQKTITLFVAIFFTQFIFAQTPMPNSDFENWTGVTPTSWGTSDGLFTNFGLPAAGTAERDTNAANVFSGTSSVKLTNKFVVTPIASQNIPGVLNLGTLAFDMITFSVSANGVPYIDRPDSIRFAAKLTGGVTGADTGNVAVTLTKWTPTGRFIIARTIVRIYENSNFNVFTTKIEYHSNQTPDSVLIQAVASSSKTDIITESQMWVDDFSFIGLDTTFKAYINPHTDSLACAGDTVTLFTDSSATNTFEWYKDNALLNAETQSNYSAVTSGNYFVRVNNNGSFFSSDTVTLVINPLPQVTFTLDNAQDTVCSNASSIPLIGGLPASGYYAGGAVTNNHFNPSQASAGLNEVAYYYTDNNGCKAGASQDIFVMGCTDIQETAEEILLNVYPNPVEETLTISSPEKIFDIEISDLNGKILFSQKNSTDKSTVNCSLLASGIYFIKIIAGDKMPVQKFSKQ